MLDEVTSVALTSASHPLSPVSDIIHSSPPGLTSSTRTHEVWLWGTQSLPIICILLDGPLCRWKSACLTHSSSVWPPPPFNLLPLFVSLVVSFSSPGCPMFVLIFAGVMWAWGSQGDKRRLRSFQSFGTSVTFVRDLQLWNTNTILLSLSVEAPLTKSGYLCTMVAKMPGNTATEHFNPREQQIWAVHL